jgi:quercetin dioxygenase-like cupin family protein
MKKSFLPFIAVLFLIVVGTKVHAQDVCKTNPSYCKILVDTAEVKMMLITLKPGERLATHTHPWNFGYVLKGGLYKWTYSDGKTESAQMKEGDSFAGAPEGTHHSWNAGKTTIQFVLYEKQD